MAEKKQKKLLTLLNMFLITNTTATVLVACNSSPKAAPPKTDIATLGYINNNWGFVTIDEGVTKPYSLEENDAKVINVKVRQKIINSLKNQISIPENDYKITGLEPQIIRGANFSTTSKTLKFAIKIINNNSKFQGELTNQEIAVKKVKQKIGSNKTYPWSQITLTNEIDEPTRITQKDNLTIIAKIQETVKSDFKVFFGQNIKKEDIDIQVEHDDIKINSNFNEVKEINFTIDIKNNADLIGKFLNQKIKVLALQNINIANNEEINKLKNKVIVPVAVPNSITADEAREDGDIDKFIKTKILAALKIRYTAIEDKDLTIKRETQLNANDNLTNKKELVYQINLSPDGAKKFSMENKELIIKIKAVKVITIDEEISVSQEVSDPANISDNEYSKIKEAVKKIVLAKLKVSNTNFDNSDFDLELEDNNKVDKLTYKIILSETGREKFSIKDDIQVAVSISKSVPPSTTPTTSTPPTS